MVKFDFAKGLRGIVPSKLRDRELVGQTLRGERGGEFLLSAPIGESVLSPSFLALDQRGERVVTKLFRPEVVDESARERLLMHHRGLCQIVEDGGAPRLRTPVDQGVLPGSRVGGFDLPPTAFTVARYVSGHSLAELRDSDQTLLRTSIPVLETITHTLEALASAGELHRNLKLSNVFVGDDATTTVADPLPFHLTGLISATFVLAPSSEAALAAPELHAELRTVGFHATEKRADVFGFAHLVFQLLTGRCAWDTDNAVRAAFRTAFAKPRALSMSLDRRPVDFTDLSVVERLEVEIRRGLGPRETRHGSVRELWESLRPLLGRALAPPAVQAPAVWPAVATSASRTPLFGRLRDRIRSLSFSPRTRSVVALTESRVHVATLDGEVGYREGGHGRELPTSGLDPAIAGGVLAHANGPILWSTHHTVQMTWSGEVLQRSHDESTRWLSGVLDRDSAFLLGVSGAPPSAVVVDLETMARTSAWACPALLGVTRLPNGQLLACGDYGALVLFRRDSERVERDRSGHLRAVVADAHGMAFAVGSGGHALAIDTRLARPSAVLEAVETVQDLVGVCLDNQGCAWAWSQNGRLVRRDRSGTWHRIATPEGESIAGAFFDAGALCLVLSDGSMFRIPTGG